MAPRPKSPPTPMANLRTVGITITHSALLRRSLGMPSGMSIISLKTWPEASRRFCSRDFSAAKAGQDRTIVRMRADVFFMEVPPHYILWESSVGDQHGLNGVALSRTVEKGCDSKRGGKKERRSG